MKKTFLLITIIHIGLISSVSDIMSHYFFPEKNVRQFIIHFISRPHDRDEHKRWNHAIYKAKKELNKLLIQKNYLQVGTLEKFSSKYSHRKNEVFFTRADHDFGSFTFYIPDGISENTIIQQLKYFFGQQGLAFHIDKDIPIHIAEKPDVGLEGISLTLQELDALKRARHNLKTKDDERLLQLLEKKTKKLSEIKDQMFWHHCIPTTGLRLETPFYPPPYPFIPHIFSLWQLAPKKGEGIKVAIIDTGVAAASFKNETQYKKNRDLTLLQNMLCQNLNIVSHNGLDPIEQLVNLTYQYIDPQKFNEVEMSQEIIRWVYDYLQNRKIDKIVSYLKEKSKKGLFDNEGKLTIKGKEAIDAITTGPYGIDPHQGKSLLDIVEMEKPYKTKVIRQLLPVVPISNQNVTYITGHGTHTYGLVAANETSSLQNSAIVEPENNNGICGIAPHASVFMIKAFKDDGTSDKSTLLAALKKAILYNADIVNMSLKIADNMDVTASLSKLLEKMIGLIPYVVTASGNGGDPRLKNYAGNVEAYPARFDSIAFDIGSFGFKDMKCPINSFSQYEKNIGPKFVAPGFNILSSGLIPNQKEDSMYIFMDGTSMAAPIMTGFVALMLAEFQKDFTREEMLNVCYTSVFHMHDDKDWNQKVLLGVLDMRTALFVLHVLREARKEKSLKNISFNRLLVCVYEIIFAPVRSYGKYNLQGADFTSDFMNYALKAQQNVSNFAQEKYFKLKSIDDAIRYVINNLMSAYNSQIIISRTDANTLQRVSFILKGDKDPDIFSHLKKETKDRILVSKTKEDYWQKQANRIRNEDIITRRIT